MRVVLFASAMLAAAGDALSLSSPGVAGDTPDQDLVLAQTGQVPNEE